MNDNLLIDLHKRNLRQGPGGEEQTKQALQLSGLLKRAEFLQIADLGCGTGAATFILANALNAHIVAVDLSQKFLDILEENAQNCNLANKISTLKCSMDELPFLENSLDAIWAEGSVYTIGFKKAVGYLKRFLKPGGIVALSEMTWLTKKRPESIQHYWEAAYPEIATASEKIDSLEDEQFLLKGYFPLPEQCWLKNYYKPLETMFENFMRDHNHSDHAKTLIEDTKIEIALYQNYGSYYGYGFYIAQKIGEN